MQIQLENIQLQEDNIDVFFIPNRNLKINYAYICVAWVK